MSRHEVRNLDQLWVVAMDILEHLKLSNILKQVI